MKKRSVYLCLDKVDVFLGVCGVWCGVTFSGGEITPGFSVNGKIVYFSKAQTI